MKKQSFICGAILASILAMQSCGSHNHSGENYHRSIREESKEELSEPAAIQEYAPENFNTESYNHIVENSFMKAVSDPLSTFSIDVDNASYANIRRFIMGGSLPVADAVRIEEMVNYFDYTYKIPSKEEPFSINTEVGECPWNKEHKLVHIGIQGYTMSTAQLPPSNLVFLVDVSGSMEDINKLPLLKQSFIKMVNQLDEKDRVAIVVYAGSSGVVLPSTSAANKVDIIAALDQLKARGSTAGAEGIQLAYQVAKENFINGGNNRVILATDGDFNVGVSSDGELTSLIEKKREEGIDITVLGFGMGNYKDSKMEAIADHGNGNYFYIDDISESHKVLCDNLAGTLYTIAKDVKIQVEFNPAKVESYRLIGYENRKMDNQDFENDKKDAGELGAGHTVTAIYEIVPTNGKTGKNNLKYQETSLNTTAKLTSEILTVKFRYKKPGSNESKLIVDVVNDANTAFENTSENFRFSAAVAGFGMQLRNSEHKGDITYDKIIEIAKQSAGGDVNGYRGEFIMLVKKAKLLSESAVSLNE